MRFLALDFETSGLRPGEHAPVTLGVALMDGETVVDSREWLFAVPTNKDGKPTRAYDVIALEISGTSWTKIKKEGRPHADVCRELIAFAREHQAATLPVVAFNAPFDFAWYSDLLFLGGSWNQVARCFQTFLPPLVGPWHCARLMACADPMVDLARYDLDGVAQHFGLSRETDKHGALEDAILAGRIYSRLNNGIALAA